MLLELSDCNTISSGIDWNCSINKTSEVTANNAKICTVRSTITNMANQITRLLRKLKRKSKNCNHIIYLVVQNAGKEDDNLQVSGNVTLQKRSSPISTVTSRL